MNRQKIQIKAPARIHCGLINESGIFRRIDGGIGFAVSNPFWNLEVCLSEKIGITGKPVCAEHKQAIAFVIDILSYYFRGKKASIKIINSIPPHIGLGSKTSLMMSVGIALFYLNNEKINNLKLAAILRRGGTSGIGVNTFQHGKFVWDTGHEYPNEKNTFGPSSNSLSKPPFPIFISPIDWLTVVHFRFVKAGTSGKEEVDIFNQHCPIPKEETEKTISSVSQEIIPSIINKVDDLLFYGLNRIQKLGFKKVEWAYQDYMTKKFYQYWLESEIQEALGLSSFGPTLYVLTKRPSYIVDHISAFEHRPLHIIVAKISNKGHIYNFIGEKVWPQAGTCYIQ